MFPKGPRFVDPKIPDFPGPNAYNIPDESRLDSHKRGAFLEKADRFTEDKISDVPGPGAYNTDPSKPDTMKAGYGHRPQIQVSATDLVDKYASLQRKLEDLSNSDPVKAGYSHRPQSQVSVTNLVEKYAALQRKLEDLERIHTEGKKSSQTETSSLKNEVVRLHRVNVDQSERLDKQKKACDLLEARVQELKKSSIADQAEIKDLRFKLRMLENERTQLLGKQSEVGDAKKALQAAEGRRKDDVRERERKIGELEKTLLAEERRRTAAEKQLEETKVRTDGEVKEVRGRMCQLQTQLEAASVENLKSRKTLGDLQMTHADLISQLGQCRDLLSSVAAEYGKLASSTVSRSTHEDTKQEKAVLQAHVFRLERKVANAETQSMELANLMRCAQEDIQILKRTIRDREDELSFYAQALQDRERLGSDNCDELRRLRECVEKGLLIAHNQFLESRVDEMAFTEEFYGPMFEDLLSLHKVGDELCAKLIEAHSDDLECVEADRNSLAAQLEEAKRGVEAAQSQLAQISSSLLTIEELKSKLTVADNKVKELENKREEASKKERDAAQKLAGSLQKCKTIEDGLRAEIHERTTDLMEAEGYKNAYHALAAEIDGVLARNALAEEESERLGKLNAEILGHHNPAQKIMYVESIRRELAETKQKLLVATKNNVDVLAGNEELRHELDMYKSVMVPIDSKPRTQFTRIDRAQNLDTELDKSTNGATVFI